MSSQTGRALERSIAQLAAVSDPQMHRFLMFAEIFFDVKNFLAVTALERWFLMINHVSVEIAQGIEDLSTFIAGYFLFRSCKK